MAERKHPDWIKVRAPVSPEYFRTRRFSTELKLHSVCQEACCPNIGECFSHRTATFMLMGDVCTRNCPYCAVAHGRSSARPRLTMTNRSGGRPAWSAAYRSDLGGSRRFGRRRRGAFCRDSTRDQIEYSPASRVEILVPDFRDGFPASRQWWERRSTFSTTYRIGTALTRGGAGRELCAIARRIRRAKAAARRSASRC